MKTKKQFKVKYKAIFTIKEETNFPSFALNHWVIDTKEKLKAIRKVFEGVTEYAKITGKDISYNGTNLTIRDQKLYSEKHAFDKYCDDFVKKHGLFYNNKFGVIKKPKSKRHEQTTKNPSKKR